VAAIVVTMMNGSALLDAMIPPVQPEHRHDRDSRTAIGNFATGDSNQVTGSSARMRKLT
jgi:hypothetical protein